MNWLGDYPEDATTVVCMFTTHDSNGAPVAPLSAFEADDIKIYKNGNNAQKTSTNGVTMTSPFDSIVGLHCVVIDTSNDTSDSGFWTSGGGGVYTIVLNPDTETVNSQTALKVIGQFGIALSPALRPTVAGRTLNVSSGGVGDANLAQILATALTETAGLLAGGFKKFFNVSTPTGTLNSIPDAVAGASGGILISGSNSGTTTLAALTITGATTHTGNVVLSDGLTISAPSTLNRAGITITGNGTGAALSATGGATGQGFLIAGGGTSGDGIKVTTTSGHGMNLAPAGSNMHGLLATGGNGGTSDGIKAAAGTGGVDIRGNITGNITGTLSTVTTVTGFTASDVGSIKTKTDFLPSATAGSAGGVFIAGTNAATTVTTALTTTFTGNLTGNVGGNVTGSVGSVATGGIAAASFAAGAIDAAAIAANAIGSSEIADGAITAAKIADGAIDAATFASGALDAVWSVGTRLLTAGTNIVLAKGTGVTGFNDLSAAQVNAEADTALSDVGVTTTITGRIDAAISSRLASASYTAPDNSSITAIKLKTDSLTFSVSGKIDANILYVNGIGVTGSGTSGDPWGPV